MSILLPIIFIIVVTAIDQLSKYWASTYLQYVGTIPIIEDVFHLTYAENTGMAFSLFSGQRWVLVLLSLLAVVAMISLLKNKYVETKLGVWSVYTVLAGAIGNIIDRIRLGYVVDMFDFRLINFAIFNVADTFVCIGGGLFIIYAILEIRKERQSGKDSTDSDGE